jgi:hypothetical protein
MVIAALVSFGILLVAWIVAPEQPTATVQEVPLTETQPLAA